MVTATAIYNEIEPYAAAWLGNLASAGHIASGEVDARSILDVQPSDVAGARQAHFFAGIGCWSHALRLAGWPDDVDVWTGSCPCQPFSVAGKKGKTSDARHLWPEWFRLIRACLPPIVFGEQVASPDGLGWLDAVFADLEGAGYTCAAADLCAAGVGAPHIRQRLYFVAVASGERREGLRLRLQQRRSQPAGAQVGRGREARGLADDDESRLEGHTGGRGDQARRSTGRPQRRGWSCAGLVEHADLVGTGRLDCAVSRAQNEGEGERQAAGPVSDVSDASGAVGGFWSNAEWVPCLDGKCRPIEPGTFPLVDGPAPGRVGRLRAYGNAIVPQVAATFTQAVMEVL